MGESDGTEPSVFSGNTPCQSAMKAARRLDAAPSEARTDREVIRLRKRGTDRINVYEAGAREEEAPDEGSQWLAGMITEANVSKEGVKRLDE